MQIFGYVKNRKAKVKVVFANGEVVEGPLLGVLTRMDVLKHVESAVVAHTRP
ncbi:hypothetical protein DNHGIG_39880 [Collibacillus ludicampi]|uniref:Uncharacterized protein n=1 Tax=Collibacillus ludicampi TaxID=2771369 RepID=A0AAV4LKW7_9BACL|nr:hypothetical protein [Collibacillus ludicampi]GIM48439.1 hypothetical protein DNHGIG_39880 [Collibacillus ludicampi]